MESEVHQMTHFLKKMQNTYAASILTTNIDSISKINNRSKRMLCFCLLLRKTETPTIVMLSKKSTLWTIQLQKSKQKLEETKTMHYQEVINIMMMKEPQF